MKKTIIRLLIVLIPILATGCAIDYAQNNVSATPTEQTAVPEATVTATSTPSRIGEAAAKAAALKHAGLSESDVTRLEVKIDRENGRLVYEVEFYVGNTEYEYDIDAYTGEIIKFEIEH